MGSQTNIRTLILYDCIHVTLVRTKILKENSKVFQFTESSFITVQLHEPQR